MAWLLSVVKFPYFLRRANLAGFPRRFNPVYFLSFFFKRRCARNPRGPEKPHAPEKPRGKARIKPDKTHGG
jgi:hypothetical protein